MMESINAGTLCRGGYEPKQYLPVEYDHGSTFANLTISYGTSHTEHQGAIIVADTFQIVGVHPAWFASMTLALGRQ